LGGITEENTKDGFPLLCLQARDPLSAWPWHSKDP